MALTLPVMVLAAGLGARMGSPKGLVLLGGVTFLEWQIARLGEAGVGPVVVVLGHGEAEYRAQVPFVNAALATGTQVSGVAVRALVNPDPERGPFSSLVLALEHALASYPTMDGAFVLPVDVPCPERSTWGALVSAFARRSTSPCTFVPLVKGRGGHPVLFDRAFAEGLVAPRRGEPSQRLDHAIRALREEGRVRVPVEDLRAVMNLNTPEDFADFVALRSPAPSSG